MTAPAEPRLAVAMLVASLALGCAQPERAPAPTPQQPAPALPYSQGIQQVARMGSVAFETCDPCLPPTPKTLKAGATSAAAPVAAVRPAVPAPVMVKTPQVTETAQVTKRFLVRFDLGQSRLRPPDTARIAALQPLIAHAQRISVHGFTDRQGSHAVNERLANARAAAVAARLADHTAAPLQTGASALCCYEAPGESPEAHAVNRRAVVVMHLPNDSTTQRLASALAAHLVPANTQDQTAQLQPAGRAE